MPTLDVTDVLDDPDLSLDPFVVTRPGVVPQTSGLPAETDEVSTQYGTVVPARSNVLQLLPEGSYQQGTIEIFTRFNLRTGKGTQYEADIVTWHGANYTVVSCDDWSGYGQGYYHATATFRDVNP